MQYLLEHLLYGKHCAKCGRECKQGVSDNRDIQPKHKAGPTLVNAVGDTLT